MLLVSTTKPATAKILPKPEQEPGPQVGEAGTWNWGAPAGFVEMVTSRWHGRVVVEWNFPIFISFFLVLADYMYFAVLVHADTVY